MIEKFVKIFVWLFTGAFLSRHCIFLIMCSLEVEVIVQSDEIAQEVLWKLHDKYEKN
jgi:hypothetical protein